MKTFHKLYFMYTKNQTSETVRKSYFFMDATYKTTEYELALFFWQLKPMLVIQWWENSLYRQKLQSKLQKCLKFYLPEWNPKFFMTDYSEAEIGAITSVFPLCQTYLCDFHREQAWERWTKDRKHGLSTENAEMLLCLLRNCAHVPSPTDASLPVDSYYQQQVEHLKQIQIWQHNEQVRD